MLCQALRSEHREQWGWGGWEWGTGMGWGRLSSHRNRATRSFGQPEKLEGSGHGQSSLQRSQVLLQARAGKEPGTALGSSRAMSTKEQSPRGHGEERRNLQQVCSGDRVGSTKGNLQPVPSLLHTLREHFLPKNNGQPVPKALFPNIHARVSGSGGLFSYCIFLKIDGGILSCLLIQTPNLNHFWFRSGQLPSFHSAHSFPGKKLSPLGSLHFLYSPLISQLSTFQFHYIRSFFATCVLSITMNLYVVFKTSILSSSLFQNVLLCRVQSSFKHTFCSYRPASCIAFIITWYIQAKAGQ